MLRILIALVLVTGAFAQTTTGNAPLFVRGLEQMTPENRRPSVFIELEPADVPYYVELLRQNPAANESARALTLSLRQSGAIAPNEQIFGVSDGRAIKARADLVITGR